MGNQPETMSASPLSWKPMWAAGIAGGVVAALGIGVRLAILHEVSPLEDSILSSLQEFGLSIVLQPNWTEPLVGLTEVGGFAALGVMVGCVAAVLHWSARRAACLMVAMGGLAQLLVGLLPRSP